MRVVRQSVDVVDEVYGEIGIEHDFLVDAVVEGEIGGDYSRTKADDGGNGGVECGEKRCDERVVAGLAVLLDDVPWDAEFLALEAEGAASGSVVDGCVTIGVSGGVIVVTIITSNGGENIGSILDSAGEWTDGILVLGDGDDLGDRLVMASQCSRGWVITNHIS